MRVRWWRVGVGLATAGAVVWFVRARPALVRAALIRVAVLVEDVVRVGQIALLRVFRRSTTPLLIPFVGHGSPQRVQLGARAVLGRPRHGPGTCPRRTAACSRRPVARCRSPPGAPAVRSCARAWRAS